MVGTNVIGVISTPLHTVWLGNAPPPTPVTPGFGYTVTVKLDGMPTHVLAVAVNTIVPNILTGLVLDVVNVGSVPPEAKLPEPVIPPVLMAALLLVHAMFAPAVRLE